MAGSYAILEERGCRAGMQSKKGTVAEKPCNLERAWLLMPIRKDWGYLFVEAGNLYRKS